MPIRHRSATKIRRPRVLASCSSTPTTVTALQQRFSAVRSRAGEHHHDLAAWRNLERGISGLRPRRETKYAMKYLKERPEIIEKNLKTFREEMQDLKAMAPVILAFGKDTHKLLSENLNKNEYHKLIKLTHYSHQIGKEAYKEVVFKEIGSSVEVSG
jgi:hypothetical protein